MIIDKETKPHCTLTEKKFEWGEPYTIMTPIFVIPTSEQTSLLEFSIDIYGENNFKQQLLFLYNKLRNYEDDCLENLDKSIKNREELINRINAYLQLNLNLITPWEKYKEYYNEIDQIKNIESLINKRLIYVLSYDYI